MLILFAKYEFDGRFHFFKNNYQKIGFHLQLDDVNVMSSKVHKWKVHHGPLYDMNVLFKWSLEKSYTQK